MPNDNTIEPNWENEMAFSEEEADTEEVRGVDITQAISLSNDILATNFIVTSIFGIEREIEVNGVKKKGLHYGLDVDSVEKKIFATCNGVIVQEAFSSSYGNYVLIYDPVQNLLHRYGHMKERCLLDKGNEVFLGCPLGYIGRTGFATGEHVHYEVIKNKWTDLSKIQLGGLTLSDYIDPAVYLGMKNVVKGSKWSIIKDGIYGQGTYIMKISVKRLP